MKFAKMNSKIRGVLEETITEVYGVAATICYKNNKILVQGNMTDIQELQIHIFIFGFLHGWKKQIEKNDIKIFNPEVI